MTPAKPKAQPRVSKVLIVDDHPAIREGLAIRISRQPDLEVCGQAADVGEALAAVDACHPDLAVIDISLKQGNGIDLIKRIKARHDPPRMLVWSMYDDSLYADRALRAGAMGYINKSEATDRIIDALRTVLADNVYLSESATSRILSRSVGGGQRLDLSPIERLSDREMEIFELIGQGLDMRQIAACMHVSPKTVDTYRGRIKAKLNIDSTTELVRLAIQASLEKS